MLEEVRPQVAAFALAMEKQLRENDHKGGWRHMGNGTLMARVGQELVEFADALPTHNPDLILSEAADVANFLLMVCQNNGALGEANDAPCGRKALFPGKDIGMVRQ